MKVVNTKKPTVNCTLSMLMGRTSPKPKPRRDQDSKPFVSFTQKLFEMVNDDQVHAINWNTEGDGFQVTDMASLCDTVFPHYFKHNSWPSFTRQLNMYGFNRVGSPHSSCDINLEFKHPQFLRSSPEKLSLIHRRVASTSEPGRIEFNQTELVSHVDSLQNLNQQLQTQIHDQETTLVHQEQTMSQVAFVLSNHLKASYQPELADALRRLQSCLAQPLPQVSSPLTDYSIKLPSLLHVNFSNNLTPLPNIFNRSEPSSSLPHIRDILPFSGFHCNSSF